MTALIAFPFRVNASGSVTTFEDDSADYVAGELALMIMTRPEERELVPDYGCNDPTFGDFDEVEFLSQVELYGPSVTINTITEGFSRTGKLVVNIEFDTISNPINVVDTEVEGELE